MKFKLIIDPTQEESVTAIVHRQTTLTDRIEALVRAETGEDFLCGYADDELRRLPFDRIECITVMGGKTWAIDTAGKQYRLKQRLYEIEPLLPQCFLRISKSAMANETRLDRFLVTYTGAVNAKFKCGWEEYVSRRCFAVIKRRFDVK